MIGLVVTRLLPGGFLRFAPVGGIDPRSLLGREVLITPRPGVAPVPGPASGAPPVSGPAPGTLTVPHRPPIPAVVATEPPHVTTPEGRRKIPPTEDLVLDTGWDDATLAATVRPGDRAHFLTPPLSLMAECLTGAGLDNRAGVAALHEALLALAAGTPPVDIYLLANVQEEVGLRGIAPAGRHLRPRAAVVADVGFARQAGADAHLTLPAGKGPVLGIGPGLHPAVTARLAEQAEYHDVRLQREVFAASSGTDAWALQVAAGGIPVGLLSIPLRSMHSPAECVDFDDVRATGQLLAAFATAATEEWLSGLTTRLSGGSPA